jgi:hypothetical protein
MSSQPYLRMAQRAAFDPFDKTHSTRPVDETCRVAQVESLRPSRSEQAGSPLLCAGRAGKASRRISSRHGSYEILRRPANEGLLRV